MSQVFFGSTDFETQNQNQANQSSDTETASNTVHVSLSQVANLTRKEDGLVIHRQKVTTGI